MNIGILGAGNIAGSMARTICGMAAQGRPVTLYAVASRSQEKADTFAKAYGIPRAYGSYAAMLNDPLVKLVYIATPHSHHAEQIRQCVAAGKPVLCEKSFTANAKQAEEVLQEAKAAGGVRRGSHLDALYARAGDDCGHHRVRRNRRAAVPVR